MSRAISSYESSLYNRRFRILNLASCVVTQNVKDRLVPDGLKWFAAYGKGRLESAKPMTRNLLAKMSSTFLQTVVALRIVSGV